MSETAYRFLDEAKEIEILKYNTPTPWMNYLSNGVFHTMISQAGGGVAFYKSPQIWRINHYRFFHLPTDRSGFYFYIKDGETVFSPTAEPTPEKPEQFSAAHGMGYTRFEAEKNGLTTQALYYISPFENCLVWKLTLTAATDRTVTLFPFVELGMMEFMRELQWQCYNKHQLSVYTLDGDILVYHYGVENQPCPDKTPLVYFFCDHPIRSFDGDRDEFVGSYRSEEMPQAVEEGSCKGSLLSGGDPCFALEIPIELKTGVPQTVQVFLGTAMNHKEIRRTATHCRDPEFSQQSLKTLAKDWDAFLSKFQCSLPNVDAERMINIWNPYQVERNFQFSRNISFYATGTFRGVGFRDTAQDILAMVPFDMERAKSKTLLLLGQQYRDGHVNHYFFPTEGWDPVTSVHSDDHLWIILTCYQIAIEEGHNDFLREIADWYDGDRATVYEHLKASVAFTMGNIGEQGFPLMLHSDWNDQLFRVCREGRGESIWTSMQLGLCLRCMQELAQWMGDDPKPYADIYETQKRLINTRAWDGEWFRRAIMDDGRYLGSKDEDQAKIWLNTQTWAVLSGMAEPEKAVQAMDSVYTLLNTEMGIKKIHPSIDGYPSKENPITNYNKGCGENGAVFCHANTWAIMAECLLGRGDRAFEYYQKLLPMVAQKRAGEWRYKAEPYVYSSNIFGPESQRFGLANVSWLTGTAAWMYLAATQYILGVRPEWEGLSICPCLPSGWDKCHIERSFRGTKYFIEIIRDNMKEGVFVNGNALEGTLVPHIPKRTECYVKVFISETGKPRSDRIPVADGYRSVN